MADQFWNLLSSSFSHPAWVLFGQGFFLTGVTAIPNVRFCFSVWFPWGTAGQIIGSDSPLLLRVTVGIWLSLCWPFPYSHSQSTSCLTYIPTAADLLTYIHQGTDNTSSTPSGLSGPGLPSDYSCSAFLF